MKESLIEKNHFKEGKIYREVLKEEEINSIRRIKRNKFKDRNQIIKKA